MAIIVYRFMVKQLLPEPAFASYFPNFFSEGENNHYLQLLTSTINWKHEHITLFGKEVLQPRLTALYGDKGISYTYSHREMEANVWTSELSILKQMLEKFCDSEFNCVLLNYYRNGNDSMGWHRDNEKSLGVNPTIASLSFGAERLFEFRNYSNKKEKVKITLANGSLLIMKNKTQELYEHQVPKTKKNLETRINLTFRKIL